MYTLLSPQIPILTPQSQIPKGQLFKGKLIRFWLSDWIKSLNWVVQKGKKESEIRLDQGIQS